MISHAMHAPRSSRNLMPGSATPLGLEIWVKAMMRGERGERETSEGSPTASRSLNKRPESRQLSSSTSPHPSPSQYEQERASRRERLGRRTRKRLRPSKTWRPHSAWRARRPTPHPQPVLILLGVSVSSPRYRSVGSPALPARNSPGAPTASFPSPQALIQTTPGGLGQHMMACGTHSNGSISSYSSLSRTRPLWA
jgi:hypothetical protein